MKFTGLKYIEIDLDGKYTQNLPEVMDLAGRHILTVVATTNVPYERGKTRADYSKLFINLFDEKGQNRFVENYPIENIEDDRNNGMFLNVNRVMNLPTCYIYNPEQVKGTVNLVIAYQKDDVSYSLENKISKFINIEVNCSNSNSQNKHYFPDVETINGCKLKSIELSGNTISILGQSVIVNEIEEYFLTLQKGIVKAFDRIPLTFFRQKNYWQKYQLKNILFDTENSYIEVSENSNVSPSGKVISLILKYY